MAYDDIDDFDFKHLDDRRHFGSTYVSSIGNLDFDLRGWGADWGLMEITRDGNLLEPLHNMIEFEWDHIF